MVTVTLTDDEIVAFVVRGGGQWMAALPTIDQSDEKELLRAVLRGERSIALRGDAFRASDVILREVEVADLVSQCTSELPTLVGYEAVRGEPGQPRGVSFAVFRVGAAGGDRVLALTLPSGLTEFTRIEPAEARAFVATFVAGSVAEPAKSVVLVLPRTIDDGDTVTISSAGVMSGAYTSGGADLVGGGTRHDVPEEFYARV